VFRIIPAYYAAVILMILLFHHEYLQPQRWQELVLFFTLFMDSSPATYQYLNGPFWTLAVEWQFYLLLPLLALGMSFFVRGNSPQRRVWVLICCLLVVVAWGVFSRYWGRYFAVYPTQSLLIPRSWLNVALFSVWHEWKVSGRFWDWNAHRLLLCLHTFCI
jgi:peptidoglycan/LPS O-acetylase OafA/YrhL